MSEDRTAMLFCPPLPPVRLGEGASVTIGRQAECEFNLRCDDVSRRHAEVSAEAGAFVLRDLGSTNGTFVNGQPLEGECELSGGDRIEIGSSTISFCTVDAGVAPDPGQRDDARTVIFERKPEPDEPRLRLSGDLCEIPVSALFQLLEMGNNSGLLEIEANAGAARVWFELGRPIHAESEKHRGFDAAIDATAVREGQFRFGPQPEPVEPTITASVTELLLEGCRMQDEGELD